MISSVLKTYGINDQQCRVEPLASGLINRTWKVTQGNEAYILQRINDSVFTSPFELATNIRLIDQYLQRNSPDYLFVSPVKNLQGDDIVHDPEDGYFRLFPFIKDSHTVNVVTSPEQAFEAALQFGKFTHLLSGFDATRLSITIPDFHNLVLRYRQFEMALVNGNPDRIRQAVDQIVAIQSHRAIVSLYEKIRKNETVKHRVTHHDTKISNVLFGSSGKGVCVIDLDTVMPGYYFSDMGDMMRTYLSPANEEEGDYDKIGVREDFFRAIVQGYLSDMAADLSPDECDLIFYSGQFMIYMQAIRFLTDYMNDDSYYGARYEGHNLVRAGNQIVLLNRLMEKETVLQQIIQHELGPKRRVVAL
jgi:hypothetical protein